MEQSREDTTQGTAKILAAIQSSGVVLETKMHSMAMDINHLGLDLRKVGDRDTTNEEETNTLQRNVKDLHAIVETLKSNATQMEYHLKDIERRSHRNTLLSLGFPNYRRALLLTSS
ncbi:hypothetical protein NDU88_000777 [Pleurodeles waltl]|uniref:Uncharacterized protein n=1 Tax=Pleurodeles waltl TaxID=8319 RepID=A0AAV7S7Z5_PLEWA|nr:hypothetical protein NDU88_000777 [Pleurodeles waltl]